MKELKNKEIMIGLIALIVLSIVAIVLIVKREMPKDDKTSSNAVLEMEIQEEAIEEAADTASDMREEADISVAEANIGIIDEPVKEAKKDSNASLALYSEASVTPEFHPEPVLIEYTGEEAWQLEEIYFYWNDYKLDAVDDLIHLPRVRTITNELNGTNNFYYYGAKDSKGNPSGTGLAVYADNAYYFGNWKDGKRSGQGMYWKVFPDKTGAVNKVPGVMEHIYNGKWANDYPNGEGQEHITYDCSLIEGEYIINNVIGNFVDGYYDGELYIMTIEQNESTTDWEADAIKGVYEYIGSTPGANGTKKVWERTSEQEDKNENYRWLLEEENNGFGIYGLKKAR